MSIYPVLLVAAMPFAGCATFQPAVSAVAIREITLGDTFDQVRTKVGEPHQIVSEDLTSDGLHRVIWLYEAVARPQTSWGPIQQTPQDALATENRYQVERSGNPPYLIIFTDGEVSSIKRQGQGGV